MKLNNTKDVTVILHCDINNNDFQVNTTVKNLGIANVKKIILINSLENINIRNTDIEIEYLNSKESVIDLYNKILPSIETNYILLLKDFLNVSKNYLADIKSTFHNYPDTVCVVPKVLDHKDKVLSAGSNFFSNGNLNHFGYGLEENKFSYKFNFVREVQFNSFSSIFFKTEILKTLDILDNKYVSLEAALCDLQLNALSKGMKILYQPKAAVVSGRMSFMTTCERLNIDKERIAAKYKEIIATGIFEGKHRKEYNGFSEDKEHLFIFDYQMMAPDKDAGSLRAFNIIKILQEKFHISLVLKYQNFIPEEDFLKYYDFLTQRKIRVVVNEDKNNIDLDNFLTKAKEEVKKIIIFRPDTGAIFYKQIKNKLDKDIKIVFDTVDIHHLRFETERELLKEDKSQTDELRKQRITSLDNLIYNYKSLEWYFYHKVDEILAVTKDEIDYMTSRMAVPAKKIKFCPIIFETNPTSNTYKQRKDMLFIGSFWHTPNILAIKYFINEVAPALEKRGIDIRLNVVGSHSEIIDDLEHPMMIKHGFIEDPDNFFNETLLSFQPLWSGAGMKGKVTQSLARGIPVVTTPIGAQGYINPEKYMIIGNNCNELVNGIEMYMKNQDLWERNRKEGLEYIKENLSFEAAKNFLKTSILYS